MLMFFLKGKVMKKLMSNNVVCGGSFCGPDIEEGTFHGPDIEEGTFHEPDADTDVDHHGKATPGCPCPPVESPGDIVSEDTNEDISND